MNGWVQVGTNHPLAPVSVNILNIPQYRVLSVDEKAHDYHVYAESANTRVLCPHCRSDRLTGWGTREVLFKDLPMHGKRVGIYIRARRLRCDDCERTFQEHLPALSEARKMTQRLLQWIGAQSLRRSFTSIAEEVGIDEGTVRNVFRDYVNELEATFEVETPRWLGIDEIHIVRPRCVVANVESRTIVNILPDRNKRTVVAYLNSLPGHEGVRYVAMDMWNPYREAARAVIPQAKVIVDKFHVLRMANVAMEQVRKKLRGSLPPKQRRGLMHDRFILLKRAAELMPQEKLILQSWSSLHPMLGEAYRLKEAFFAIYDAHNKVAAADRYQAWAAGIPPAIKAEFTPILTAWKNWDEEILAYFAHPITNAYTESLNALIRVMNRIGRGYSFEALRAKILFTEGPHKHASRRPKFERQVPGGILPSIKTTDSIHRYGVPTWEEETESSLGIDIPTLTTMIEDGRFPAGTNQ